MVEGRYFEAVGIPLLSGRTFGPEDDGASPRRVVVSQELARQVFPSDDPIGKRLRVAGALPEIIGVVGDVAIGPRASPRPYVYHSHSQFAGDRNWELTQVVALDGDRPGLLADARRELSSIDPALVLHDPRMLDDVIGGGVAQERFALLLVATFAALALVLAAVGLYGVLSYSVSRRSREMGIRLALGATPRSVRSMIVRDGGRLAVIGIGLGVAGAIAATRLAPIAAVRGGRDRPARLRGRGRSPRPCRVDGELDARARGDEGRPNRHRKTVEARRIDHGIGPHSGTVEGP